MKSIRGDLGSLVTIKSREVAQGLTFEVLQTSCIREIWSIEHGGIRIPEGWS
jgi:hypothetical protein